MMSSVVSGLKTKFSHGWPSAHGADRIARVPVTSVATASSATGTAAMATIIAERRRCPPQPAQ